jgi:hypothetical protein
VQAAGGDARGLYRVALGTDRNLMRVRIMKAKLVKKSFLHNPVRKQQEELDLSGFRLHAARLPAWHACILVR